MNDVCLVGMKVLIVDDIAESNDVLAITLESEGYEVAAAMSGEEALQIAEAYLPDLVLMDVRMGGIDGFDTCRRLKNNKVTSNIPVIFITASARTKDIEEGFSCGGVDYVTKPFRQGEVLARVRAHLHIRRLLERQEKLINELRDSLKKVKTLSGLLPICAWCKNVRDDKGYWNQLEAYLRDNSEVDFTHAICPDCNNNLWSQRKKTDKFESLARPTWLPSKKE